MVYITRKEYFNAAHKLYNDNWSEAENRHIYGVCANENWHGHNFELIVTVKGKPHPEAGWVMDMKQLGKLIQVEITDKLDHKNMNLDVDFLEGIIPTCENVVIKIWNILAPKIELMGKESQAKLHCIKLIETRKNSVEYYGN